MSDPFTTPNNRIFYACQGVWTGDGGTGATNWLPGVQAIGINREIAPETLFDNGRLNQTFTRYGKTNFVITISRTLPLAGNGSGFFYKTSQTTYEAGHLLSSNGVGPGGESVKDYDIAIFYGSDSLNNLGAAGLGAEYSVYIFKHSLLTNISYNISVDGTITEDLTFQSQMYDQLNDSTWTDFSDAASSAGSLPQGAQNLTRKDIDISNCIFPKEVNEAFNIGNEFQGSSIFGLQSINIDCSFSYRDLPDTGVWRGSDTSSEVNRWKVMELPVAITASFTGLVRSHYFVSSADQNHTLTDTYHTAGTYGAENKGIGKYKTDRQIRILTNILYPESSPTDLFQWDLGNRNYLTSFDVTGGDTGGGNIEATLSFQNDCSDLFLYQGATAQNYVPLDGAIY